MINNIYDQLKRDESFRDFVYTDTVGKHTIGYGHNLDAKPLPFTTITLEQGDEILRNDVAAVVSKLNSLLPWIGSLDTPRFGVLTNMAFNMGVEGLLEFHHMLTYLQYGEYSCAAGEMIKSKWYNEVGDRAKRLAAQMTQGVWQ